MTHEIVFYYKCLFYDIQFFEIYVYNYGLDKERKTYIHVHTIYILSKLKFDYIYMFVIMAITRISNSLYDAAI